MLIFWQIFGDLINLKKNTYIRIEHVFFGLVSMLVLLVPLVLILERYPLLNKKIDEKLSFKPFLVFFIYKILNYSISYLRYGYLSLFYSYIEDTQPEFLILLLILFLCLSLVSYTLIFIWLQACTEMYNLEARKHGFKKRYFGTFAFVLVTPVWLLDLLVTNLFFLF